MRRLLHISFAVLLVLNTSILAQTKVKVLTRIIEKTYTFNNEFLMEIDAEKADIYIETYPGNDVSVTLNQIVKNTNERIAQEHLKAQQFIDHNTKDHLFLRNLIIFKDPKDKTGSIFKNEYTIKVPEHCHVKIKNTLGTTTLNGIRKSSTISVNYGKVMIKDCIGKINAKINLGELLVSGGTINGHFETKNTSVKLQSVEGDITADCNFGSLAVFLNGNPLVLKATTTYCETTLINKSEGSYAFNLETFGGKINAMEYSVSSTSEGNVLLISPESDGILPLITVVSTENDINIY